MSVLHRLALRALGMPSPVRARLGSLFEGERRTPDSGASEAAAPAVQAVTREGFAAAQPLAGRTLLQAAPPNPAHAAAPSAIVVFSPPVVTAISAAPVIQREAAASPPAGARSEILATEFAVPGPSRSVTAAVPATAEPPPVRLPASEPGELPPAAAAFRPLLPEFVAPPTPSPPTLPHREVVGRGQPEIQISIGRIEVRGEAERRRPAPVPRPAPALMSLEDYLAKGRRR